MQGFNMGRYVPPDVEGTTSGNKLNKKHPLGSRASKLASHGILTVRFEMPFPVWCAHCPKPTIIGQGVRFNAEKKRAGSYYTTPIWSFRFRHADCGGWIEMRTDPKNTAYVVVEGAAKRDTGEEKALPGDQAILTEQEREELRKNAFASLEKTIADRERLKLATERIDDLVDLSKRHWDDPYAQNQRLRKAFRVGRKERDKAAAATEHLKDRMGLAIDLLPEREEDAQRAALVDFGSRGEEGDEEDGRRSDGDRALSKPLFASSSSAKTTTAQNPPSSSTKDKRLKSEKVASRRKETFVAEFISNTRAAQDPFLHQNGDRASNRLSLGIVKKRKRTDGEVDDEGAGGGPETKVPTPVPASAGGLVQYDSD
ncbi:duf455 domain protein [Trichoderma arundinaceum]|uniref:Duf455 domain protein n=1 Tax=Trichoderma arundinaceum TaxID=490622 RepID=A0A395NW89_TRIAR|nr:duf455 domain protein [Trichoderma arundinaceum]